MLGTVKPIANAAVAHDGQKTLAMLKKKPREGLQDLLGRLDAAIAESRASGQRVRIPRDGEQGFRVKMNGIPEGREHDSTGT